MHTTLRITALALVLASCSAEPAGGDMQPLQGALGSKPTPKPAPKPVEPIEPKLVAATPCAAMSDTQLDFIVDSNSGAITSVEANARIEADAELSAITLYATNTGNNKNGTVSVSVRMVGTGSAGITDGSDAYTRLAAGTTTLTLSVPTDKTFTLNVTPSGSTGAQVQGGEGAELAAIPHLPAGAKKAIIKPVPQCPG